MKKNKAIIILMMLMISVFTQAQIATIDGTNCSVAADCPKFVCQNSTKTLVAGITSGSVDSVVWRQKIYNGNTWTPVNGYTTIGTTATIAVPVNEPATVGHVYRYQLIVYVGGTGYSSLAEMSVNPSPTATLLSNDSSVCAGTLTTFTASSGGSNYAFKANGSTLYSGASSLFQPVPLSNNDTITVTITDANGCTKTSTPIVMTVYPKPEATNVVANTISTPGCVGQTTNVNITGLKGTGPWSLEVWNTSGGNPTTLYYSIGTVSTANPSAQGIIIPAIGANNLFLGVTDSHGCKNKP